MLQHGVGRISFNKSSHPAEVREIEGILYCNDGDWVEVSRRWWRRSKGEPPPRPDGWSEHIHFSAQRGDMNPHPFRAKAYLMVGCPFSFRFLLFASEARLLDNMEIVCCDPAQPEFEEIKAKLQQTTGAKASFPTVEIEAGEYKSDSGDLIDYYAQRAGTSREKLRALSFYEASIFPQLIECHEAKQKKK